MIVLHWISYIYIYILCVVWQPQKTLVEGLHQGWRHREILMNHSRHLG
jgi:hypothetical protein